MPLADPGVDALDPGFYGGEPDTGAMGDGFSLQVMGQLAASLGDVATALNTETRRRQRLSEELRWAPLPPIQGNPAAGVLTLANAEIWGPKTGYFWAIQRITVAGLTGPLDATSTSVSGEAPLPTTPNETVAATPVLPAGIYTVTTQLMLSGTASVTDINNMQLYVGAVAGPVLAMGDGTETLTTTTQQVVVPPGGATIGVHTIAAGTSTANYWATIIATLQSSDGDEVIIYKGQSGQSGVVPQNQVSPPVTATSQYNPGRTDLILQPGDFLTVAGTGLASSSVTVSADMIIGTLGVLADFLV
jgi:hypothetical protein